MTARLIGVLCILIGSGAVGFRLASSHRREIRYLRMLSTVLVHMISELNYRVTPLPRLCRIAAREATGCLQKVFNALSEELEGQISPDAKRCMQAAVQSVRDLPACTRSTLLYMGDNFGRFDLEGQISGLKSVCKFCDEQLQALENNKDARLRSYQTLGLCSGAALAIVLL